MTWCELERVPNNMYHIEFASELTTDGICLEVGGLLALTER
jgi:hypothetical protein